LSTKLLEILTLQQFFLVGQTLNEYMNVKMLSYYSLAFLSHRQRCASASQQGQVGQSILRRPINRVPLLSSSSSPPTKLFAIPVKLLGDPLFVSLLIRLSTCTVLACPELWDIFILSSTCTFGTKKFWWGLFWFTIMSWSWQVIFTLSKIENTKPVHDHTIEIMEEIFDIDRHVARPCNQLASCLIWIVSLSDRFQNFVSFPRVFVLNLWTSYQ